MKSICEQLNMYEHLENHFTPNESIVSYSKLLKLVNHQIKLYNETQEKIEQNTLYYLLKDEQTLKDYNLLETKKEEWEWLKQIIEERYEIITL